MSEPDTRTVDAPGATIHYDVRSNASSTEPPLLMIGSPMGAAGFVTLASHFPERTVVTYDPRGAERSVRTDGASETAVQEHADDLHRVIAAIGGGPVDVFASSGGAVNALALVARHPSDVRTLVAHEPPAAATLPDAERVKAAARDIHETYLRSGPGPAMGKFIAMTSMKGEVPADFADQPAPDPAMFGFAMEDDGTRNDPLLGQNMISCTHFEPDFDALRSAPTRIVVGAGAESEGEMAHRGAEAVAERLGTTVVIFPSGHGGFLGGEYGQTGDPDGFAKKLREVLGSPA